MVAACRFEKGAGLLGREGSYFLLLRAWCFHTRGHVARDQPICNRILEGLVQRSVDVPNGAGVQSGIELLSVQAPCVRSCQCLEFDPAECGLDVHPRDLLVALPGSLPHGVTYGIVKPPVEVIPEGQVTGVEGRPPLRLERAVASFAATSWRVLP